MNLLIPIKGSVPIYLVFNLKKDIDFDFYVYERLVTNEYEINEMSSRSLAPLNIQEIITL